MSYMWYSKIILKKKVKGICTVGNSSIIEHVLFIDDLKYNLLSISQLIIRDSYIWIFILHDYLYCW
jgi:hypothetical protein